MINTSSPAESDREHDLNRIQRFGLPLARLADRDGYDEVGPTWQGRNGSDDQVGFGYVNAEGIRVAEVRTWTSRQRSGHPRKLEPMHIHAMNFIQMKNGSLISERDAISAFMKQLTELQVETSSVEVDGNDLSFRHISHAGLTIGQLSQDDRTITLAYDSITSVRLTTSETFSG